MHDPLVVEGTIAGLPNDPIAGLHPARTGTGTPTRSRRSRSRSRSRSRTRNQTENNGGDDDDGDDPLLEDRDDGNGNGNGNHRNNGNDALPTPPATSPTPTPASASLFSSPFSGSIGIGVFRISKWYCLVSVLSAVLAVVVAPIPVHRMEQHTWTTAVYRVVEGQNQSNGHKISNSISNHNNNNKNKNKNSKTNSHNPVPMLPTKTPEGEKQGLSVRFETLETLVTHAAAVGVASKWHRETNEPMLETTAKATAAAAAAAAGTASAASETTYEDPDPKEPRKRRRRPAEDRGAPAKAKEGSSLEEGEGEGEAQPVAGTGTRTNTNTNSNTKTSHRNNNYNSGDERDTNKLLASWLKHWIARTNDRIVDETSNHSAMKSENASEEQRAWWKGLFQAHKSTGTGTGTGTNEKSEEKNREDYCSGEGGETKDHGRIGADDSAYRSSEPKHTESDEEWRWLDPVLWNHDSFPDLVTSIIDKILKSTVRLCVVTNFMLAMIYLLHSAVAAWFLSHSRSSSNAHHIRAMRRQQEQRIEEEPSILVTDWSYASSSAATGARERMGGFLIFKLLLISAVVAPDTLDLVILLMWFTLLGCLRSLDHLAHSTNTHFTAMGQPPEQGVVRLLFWVLACDVVAAGSCVALFHTAGLGMVLLLTCDCALLGADAVSHILKFYRCVLENSHDINIRGLEERQLELHRAGDGRDTDTATDHPEEGLGQFPTTAITTAMTQADARRESDRLDHEMEGLEFVHSRRLAVLDTGIFGLEMTCHLLTVAHFCHIWSLNGVQFTLIDGVLALHLHSAISSACTKLARRRTVRNIARDLHGEFSNATEEELKKASAAGDVCCICLGSMTKGGNVKKVHCGHLYHTHCLREVIERAQSLQSAKCPLCRAPLVGGSHPVASLSTPANGNNGIPANGQRNNNVPPVAQEGNPPPPTPAAAAPIAAAGRDADGGRDVPRLDGERALFRFSTEGILPAWVPVPAFSFEVVRRPPLGAPRVGQQPQNEPLQPIPAQPIPMHNDAANQSGGDHPGLETDGPLRAVQLQRQLQQQLQQQQQQQQPEMPFLQRLLTLTGLMPMSPEEEARALGQLVDMFPQYDRGDLARELRDRGSIDAVTEAILIGIFRGVPRN